MADDGRRLRYVVAFLKVWRANPIIECSCWHGSKGRRALSGRHVFKLARDTIIEPIRRCNTVALENFPVIFLVVFGLLFFVFKLGLVWNPVVVFVLDQWCGCSGSIFLRLPKFHLFRVLLRSRRKLLCLCRNLFVMLLCGAIGRQTTKTAFPDSVTEERRTGRQHAEPGRQQARLRVRRDQPESDAEPLVRLACRVSWRADRSAIGSRRKGHGGGKRHRRITPANARTSAGGAL